MRWLATILVASLLASLAGGAVGALQGEPDDAPRVDEIQAAIDSLGEGASDEVRARWREALETARRAAQNRAATKRLVEAAEEAPGLLEDVQAELAVAPREVRLEKPEGATLHDLEVAARTARAEADVAKKAVTDLEADIAARALRRGELPDELAEAREASRLAEDALAALDVASEARDKVALARVAVDEARTRVARLTAEQAEEAATRTLLTARLEQAKRASTVADEVTRIRDAHLEETRRNDADAAADDTAARAGEIVAAVPDLAKITKRAVEVSLKRKGEDGIPARIEEARAALALEEARLDDAKRRFRSADQRITNGGLTDAMAITLRSDFEALPREQILEAESRVRSAALSREQLERFNLTEDLVADPVRTATEWLRRQYPDGAPDDVRANAMEAFDMLASAQAAAIADLSVLTGLITQQRVRARELREVTAAYRDYIEERILWVRSSTSPLWRSLLNVPADVFAVGRAVGRGDDPSEALERAPWQLRAPLTIDWLRVWPLVGVFVALMLARSTLRRRRQEFGQLVRSYRTDRYGYTVRALVDTALLALPFPLLLWGVGSVLTGSGGSLAHALGSSLQEIAFGWGTVRFVSELLVERGIGSAHFRWPSKGTQAVRRELHWLEPVLVVCGTITLALDRQDRPEWSDSIGRLAFLVWMASSAWFLHRILRAESPIWKDDHEKQLGFARRTRRVAARVVVAVPIALGVLSALGYHYTALQFELRLRMSAGFALAVVIVNALLLRWLFIARRKLAVQNALEAKSRKERAEAGERVEHDAVLDADRVDIPSMDTQTRQLFKSSLTLATVLGLYLIWTSVLPALQGLDRVQLLPRIAVIDQEGESAPAALAVTQEPPAADRSSSEEAPTAGPGLPIGLPSPPSAPATGEGIPTVLTLGDVLLALIFVLLTTVAAKNLPALLELALLQRLPLDGGARYAITTIARYVIVVIGVSVISGALGIGWQKIQWLAAALTFGLAFGLQEIFANFVSGLIILIERPVRVGDIVTVGETEGRVTQLRMRATTIQDYDRREYLIPNKEFITSSVINWTLTDPITRIVVPVGVAYGSDTARARELILQAAEESEHVLPDPRPTAIFRRFGESTLDFDLRVFIATRDDWPLAIDFLHSRIDALLREAEIEIAFPQRDLHLRSVSGAAAENLRGEG